MSLLHIHCNDCGYDDHVNRLICPQCKSTNLQVSSDEDPRPIVVVNDGRQDGEDREAMGIWK
jgi:hypothetical protein